MASNPAFAFTKLKQGLANQQISPAPKITLGWSWGPKAKNKNPFLILGMLASRPYLPYPQGGPVWGSCASLRGLNLSSLLVGSQTMHPSFRSGLKKLAALSVLGFATVGGFAQEPARFLTPRVSPPLMSIKMAKSMSSPAKTGTRPQLGKSMKFAKMATMATD